MSVLSGLCEWAVTHRRTGSHRWLVVAELLKKRQSALLDGGTGKKAKKDEFVFQDILFKYLNESAPTWTGRFYFGILAGKHAYIWCFVQVISCFILFIGKMGWLFRLYVCD